MYGYPKKYYQKEEEYYKKCVQGSCKRGRNTMQRDKFLFLFERPDNRRQRNVMNIKRTRHYMNKITEEKCDAHEAIGILGYTSSKTHLQDQKLIKKEPEVCMRPE